jgi:hypothetical protein
MQALTSSRSSMCWTRKDLQQGQAWQTRSSISEHLKVTQALPHEQTGRTHLRSKMCMLCLLRLATSCNRGATPDILLSETIQ